MPSGRCDTPNCTVSTTGNCLLSHPRPEDCPHFSVGEVAAIDAPDAVEPAALLEEESAATTEAGRRIFHLGNELGAEDAIEIMRARYTHLIGVLGSTEAGKTACFHRSTFLLRQALCRRRISFAEA